MWLANLIKSNPAPPSFGAGKILPERTTSWFSRAVFLWLGPFLDVGYSRPLQENDLWELPRDRQASATTDALEHNFYMRCAPTDLPQYLQSKLSKSDLASTSSVTSTAATATKSMGSLVKAFGNFSSSKACAPVPTSRSPLPAALYRTFLVELWTSVFFKFGSDVLKAMSPLLNKAFLTWLTQCFSYHVLSDAQRSSPNNVEPRVVAYGIGLAIGLFALQGISSLFANHHIHRGMTMGLSMRTGVIGIIFRKSLRISGRARLIHPTGKITTMISTDASRLDRFATYGHNLWAAPLQIIIAVILLVVNLGYSGFIGLGVIVLGIPIELSLVRIMRNQRKQGVRITDTRVRLMTEVLQGIRFLKFYAWETFYLNKISTLRTREVSTIRKSAIARAVLIGVVTLIPILASALSFIAYALSGHDLNVAIIFSCLQIFNNIRTPLKTLPTALSSLSETLVGLKRISDFLTAEEIQDPYTISCEMPDNNAVQVNGSFTWEATEPEPEQPRPLKGHQPRFDETLPITNSDTEVDQEKTLTVVSSDENAPFQLKDLRLTIKKGAFVAVIGRVGSGKSSLLQSLIGEMRRVEGEVVFGGPIAYVPQVPWIQNATFRENIVFGQGDDDKRFCEVIHACNLERDIQSLTNGENTAIGEKGINLSGGQRARVSLARAAYSKSDIVLLDDPLSAIDPYVGKSILEDCILNGPLSQRTRVLVTHALYVLDKTDYIYIMDGGAIIEEGTYETLLAKSAMFSQMMDEHRGTESGERSMILKNPPELEKALNVPSLDSKDQEKFADTALMQAEERKTGSVPWMLYLTYLRFAGGLMLGPFIITLLLLTQTAEVGNTLFLGMWASKAIPSFNQQNYIEVYAGLGITQAVLSFMLSFSFSAMGLVAGINLFNAALVGVLRSPTSFFDTTPMGRIISRLSKDQDTLDIEFSTTLWKFMSTLTSVLGTMTLVFYTFPLLGTIFIPMLLFYSLISTYYCRTSVETKRLESVIRSVLYGSYSETLTGLSTIRAFQGQNTAIESVETGLDRANKAYYMTISIQRWLSVRLDLMGSFLIFGIALFAVDFRYVVDPSKVGVVLTFTLNLTQAFSDTVAQFAQNEQNMNAVERVVHYSELPSEGRAPDSIRPPLSWPSNGGVVFKEVQMAYREGLPLVLKGVNFQIKPGEKVGIVGRTGAGKSSILQALFRIVELQGGLIEVDGVDISSIELDVLRNRLALVPQDSAMFSGTLRENLDPQRLRTDAELISVMQRAWLLPKGGTLNAATEAKFSLDSVVGEEGTNFSVGEKQLLALARALVKESRIIVLDEATSSVDFETDSKIQHTIQTEFSSSTLLCIAHRLKTIAYYDRVMVMDAGEVVEFDTVFNLFDIEGSIFRSLCNDAKLSREEIAKIRENKGALL
ncbi:multidrug resistance-associated ABC transporter [Collybia nuda]|uniref:Multidrug resistance-associated ABC transporter n=1 Tax=Collybia nuda TaxID=64659 RepID=A0A9P6CHB2_9AGAR|nr:multidrug resistance-associated ABC transporter [Collybia nuda]